MSAVSISRNYADGQTLSADNYNEDRAEIVAGVNSINNAQVASDAAIAYSKLSLTGGVVNADVSGSAAIAESKLAFDTSGGHDHDGSNSKKITINRAFTWFLSGVQIVSDEVGAKYIVPENMTVTKIWYKTGSGTATLRLQKDTTTVQDSMAATSSVGSVDSITSASLTAGEVLTLDITACSSGASISVTVEAEQ